MKKRNEEIDKLFSKGLSNYEEAPGTNVWAQIEGQLPSRKNRTIYWIAASFAGVLLTASIGWNSVVKKADINVYDNQLLTSQANFPQKEFVPVPILIQTKTIVYIDRPVLAKTQNEAIQQPKVASNDLESIETQPALELQPVGATYALNSDVPLQQVELANALTSLEDESSVTIIYKKGDPKYPKLSKALNFMKEVGEGERQLIDFEKISNNLIARRETNNNSNN